LLIKPEPQKPGITPSKVLMFGWEFPPHISGGLGTACLGITQALLQENCEVLFVVPKSYGDEPVSSRCIINASSIPLPLTGQERKIKIAKPVVRIHNEKIQIPSRVEATTTTSIFSSIEIPVLLDPYHVSSSIEKRQSVTQWNYQLSGPEVIDSVSADTVLEEEELVLPSTYNFTGSYGSSLNDEVKKYADVAEIIARENTFDIIHAHDWMTFDAGIAAKKVSGKPLVLHVHATEVDRSGITFGDVYEIEKRGMESADCIIAVSHWTRQILIQHYGIRPEKIQVVHNGIMPTMKSSHTEKTSMGSHVVTFMGRVTQQKGPRYFVEAARKVADRFPEAHFVMAGSGDLLPQTIDRVAELKLSTRFHFTGFLTSDWIARIWSISNVYVMPSVSEPFGITPLEAVQAGVPVIVSKQSGVSEVLPDALKVNFWDTDALAEAICSLLQYRSLSVMMKQRGEREIQQLNWRDAAKKLTRIYHELKP
jgi:glycogen(starch) synthase